ncbi:MAG: DNA/RNA nuclease SfsA [Geobacteraceae bacterium]|nr:DNA/RNA nuclease SfsA [Geobacteraceae bacterium]
MKLPKPLYEATLIRRYQRFLADVTLPDGTTITVHCPNSGSMTGCAKPGIPVLLSHSTNQKRKLAFTLELVQVDGHWVGINTMRPNALVREAISQGIVPELAGYTDIRAEVRYGSNSRIDLLLSGPAGLCHVEVKNVTLLCGERAMFPDAVTTRGQKHLRELMQVVSAGGRGVIFFVVQREDARTFGPADSIDPEYGRLLRLAVRNGVEALAYQAHVGPEGIYLTRQLQIILD